VQEGIPEEEEARQGHVRQEEAQEVGVTQVVAVGGNGAVTAALSPREHEVVRLVAGGGTNEEIAERLVISPRTVQSHVNRAMRKTGARNRTDLAVLSVEAGLAPERRGIRA
jgi:DNA-binding CsgD family transcriptional regulator